MTDLSATIAPKSDQLNADDLIAGPRTIVITRVTASPESPEQPVSIFYEGDGGKPYKPCKSMRRVLVAAWGADASAFAGRSLTLYRDPKVQFGGLEVGGIRISHMSHLDRDMTIALTATRAKRAPYTVKRMGEAPKPRPREDGPALPPEMRERALLAARQGTVTFRAFWAADDVKPHRPALQSIVAECQRLAKEADERGAPDDGDPFSGGADPEARAREEFVAEREREMAAQSYVERGADE